MIYGFVGKAQHGKSFCTEVWQWLDDYHTQYEGDMSGIDYVKAVMRNRDRKLLSDWEQKSFAHKLKQVCSIITGEPLSKWECNDFKSSTSPFRLDESGFITYRKLLQFIGTDLFRKQLCDSIWTDAMFVDYDNIKSKWLVSDVRFENKADAIKNQGGKLIRVLKTECGKGPCKEFITEVTNEWRKVLGRVVSDKEYNNQWVKNFYQYTDLSDTHISERELENIYCDYFIIADEGDIDSLIIQVRRIMDKERVI